MEPEQQSPMIVWCGGRNADQDVSIRLVPNGINQQQVTNLHSREPLAVMKLHSTRLKKHSKYFQACLSTRWTGSDAPPSMEFNLELIHGLQVASYTECFSRLYTPGRKNFKDVKSSLELLRVASQIEFSTLVNSVCGYLSTILWSEEDELRIRQFSSSPDFPLSQVQDLVARLEIGKHGNEDMRKNLLSEQIAQTIRIALRQDGRRRRESFLNAECLFKDFFSTIRQSETHSAFENAVVTIVSKEVKEMLESFHEECGKHARFGEVYGETTVDIDVERVSGFKRKLQALCWALELLVKTQVAEEVVECLLHLEFFFPILISARVLESTQPASEDVALRFCKLMIFIFREVAAGNLMLRILDRVLLIKDWQWIEGIHDDTQTDIVLTWGFREALEGVFLTLPLEQQLEALQQHLSFTPAFIGRSSLVTLMRRNWPAEEDVVLAGEGEMEVEVDGAASDSET